MQTFVPMHVSTNMYPLGSRAPCPFRESNVLQPFNTDVHSVDSLETLRYDCYKFNNNNDA
jgi:hypothetical protein